MNQDEKKRAVAEAAIPYVRDGIIGIGTGSTVNCFIDLLAAKRHLISGAVSSSEASSQRLKDVGIEVIDLNQAGTLSLYVDGADEANKHRQLIKGGGGALTREKIVAAASKKFICIIDDSKLVPYLGDFPLPVEVIPMARSLVSRAIVALGGQPVFRDGFITDNGNEIIDVHNLEISDPAGLEQDIESITGVVSAGLFARRPADMLLVAGDDGVRTLD